MIIPSNQKKTLGGHTLAVTLCVALILGVALVCYLQLTTSQVQITGRSQAWNTCIPILEAGIEEALTHCKNDYLTNMVSNGWVQAASGFNKTRSLGGDDYYEVNISLTAPYEIVSKGYCRLPGSDQFISRTVKVITKNLDGFAGALVARNTIDMNGNNVKTDSYDSRDINKSTNGRYDPAKAGDQGDVTCLAGLVDAANIGNANVWGHVLTGFGGNVRTGPNGAVGSVAWQQAGNSGVQPGWAVSDINIAFGDVQPPFVSAPAAGAGAVNGNAYDYVLGTGNYLLPGIQGKAYVTGDAVLYVTGDISFGSSDSIELAPGATLKLYAAGANTTINSVVNPNSDAKSFAYFGLPSNTSITISGNAQFTGTVYAPSADVKMNGGIEFFGSIVASSAVLTGTSQFHYDESLGNSPPRKLTIVSWTEL